MEGIFGGDKAGHRVALRASQQLVDRHPQLSGHEVVQRDVDRRYGPGEDAAAFEILTAVELLPDGPDPHGVSSQQEFPKMFHGPRDCEFSTRHTRLSPPVVAFIRFHFQDKLIPVSDPHRVGLDVRDLHFASCRCRGSS